MPQPEILLEVYMIINKEKLQSCNNNVLILVNYLEQIYGTVIVNSGFRNVEDNAKLPNSSKNSYHCKGLAVDISVPNVCAIKIAATVLNKIQSFPIRGCGINVYLQYVHFDFRESDSVIYWSYDKNNKEA